MTSQFNIATLTLCALCAITRAHADEHGAMVVARDAANGQLRAATGAEMQALNAQKPAKPALSASPVATMATQGPTVITAPDGTMRVNVGKESLIYSITQRDANGKLQMQCVSGKPTAASALSQAPSPATAHIEEHDHDNQ